jgi:serine/threonine protein kinase
MERDERAIHRLGCQRNMEDVLTEIGIYSYLSRQQDLCPYLLKMYSAFEINSEAWLALQHADGGDLFDVIKNTELTSQQTVHWTRQLLQAVSFLHTHHVGHRDISVENILLHKGDLQLMDFGQAVQTQSTSGIPLRYFCAVGKDYCRAPERRIPKDPLVEIVAPRASHPGQIVFVNTKDPEDFTCEVLLPRDVVPVQECQAAPCGYRVPPADIFACGVCLFVMIARMPPWRETTKSDPHFAFVQNKGIAQLLRAWQLQPQPELVDLLSSMIKSDPIARPSAVDCLAHSLFVPSSSLSHIADASRPSRNASSRL